MESITFKQKIDWCSNRYTESGTEITLTSSLKVPGKCYKNLVNIYKETKFKRKVLLNDIYLYMESIILKQYLHRKYNYYYTTEMMFSKSIK